MLLMLTSPRLLLCVTSIPLATGMRYRHVGNNQHNAYPSDGICDTFPRSEAASTAPPMRLVTGWAGVNFLCLIIDFVDLQTSSVVLPPNPRSPLHMRISPQVIRTGMRHRHVGSHELNIESSRSHSIMTIFVQSTPADPGAADFGTPRIGKISFVDLAGSER